MPTSNIDILINAKDNAKPALDSVTGGLNKMGEAATQGGSKVSAMTIAVGTAIGGLAAQGIAKLGEFASSIVSTGIQFDNMKQQATIAFTTMLGDGGKAKAFLDDLQRFAAATPFEFPELVQASQKLLAMGFAAKDVKPTLTAIGDAVAGLGGGSEMIDRVTTAIGQMQAKGKAASGEMMQLTEAGIPAWQMLADKIGVTVPEAMDRVSKGAIDADTAVGAILEGMETNFGGLMDAQSRTFGGLMSTIQDTFTQVSGQVMQPFFNLMSDGLQRIVDFTSSPTFTAGVESFANWISQITVQAVDWAQNVWPSVQTAFASLMDVIQGRTSVLDFFKNLWNETWGLAQDIFQRVTDFVTSNLPTWTETLKGWADAAWQWLVAATPKVVDQLAQWQTGIINWVVTNLPGWIDALRGWELAAWQWIVEVTPIVLGKLGEWGGAITGWLGAHLPDLLKVFFEWETAAWQWVADALPKAIESLIGFVRGLRGEGDSAGGAAFGEMASGWAGKLWKWITEELIPEVKPAFTKFIGVLMNLGGTLLTELGTLTVELGKTLWKWIVDITPVALGKLADWGGALWDWIKTNAPTWMDYLAEWGAIAWQWIRDIAIPEAVKKIGEWGTALWGWLTDNVPKWVAAFGDWAKAAWAWIIDVAWPKTKEKIAEWATNLWNWLKDKGTEWATNFQEWGQKRMAEISLGFQMGLSDFQKWLNQNPFFSFLDTWLGVGFNDVITTANEYGDKTMYSYRDGVLSKIGEIKNAGNQVGQAFQDGLADNLQMHSPSRVMMSYGGDTAQGFLNGIAAFASQFADSGSMIGNQFVSGLRSATAQIADQIKEAMELTNATFRDEVATFTRQAAATYQQQYLAAVKQIQALPAQTFVPDPGIGSGTLPPATSTPAPAAPAATQVSQTLADALGVIKNIAPVVAQTQQLLGGISLTQLDLDPQATKKKATVQSAINSTFTAIKQFFDSTNAQSTLSGESAVIQGTVGQMFQGIAKTLGDAATSAGNIADAAGVNKLFKGVESTITKVIDSSLSSADIKSSMGVQQWITNIRGGINSLVDDQLSQLVDALKTPQQKLTDFIAGITGFLSETVNGTTVNKLFRDLSAYGNSPTSATGVGYVALQQSQDAVRSAMASLLGLPQIYGSLDASGNLAALTKTLSGDTDMGKLTALLQSLVNFRTTANTYDPNGLYGSALPNDPRLTGASTNTTTNYNITLTGGGNASADVLGLVQLLGSLQAGAVAP